MYIRVQTTDTLFKFLEHMIEVANEWYENMERCSWIAKAKELL